MKLKQSAPEIIINHCRIKPSHTIIFLVVCWHERNIEEGDVCFVFKKYNNIIHFIVKISGDGK